jgi:hypothetical protein
MAPKKLDDVEADAPRAWSWTRDPALLEARAAQDEVEARLSQIEQDDQRRRQDQVTAATDALHIARARRAHGSGSDGDVKKAEAQLESLRQHLEAVQGERLELLEKRSRLREVAIAETEKAQWRCCKRFRSAYPKAVRELAASLVDAQEKAVRVRQLYAAALESFPWSSVEASVHGSAAGLGAAPLSPIQLWPEDGRPRSGLIDAFLIEAADVLHRQGLDKEKE